MRIQGKITHWQDEKGFGFITPNDSRKEIFVHIRSFTGRQKRPTVNDVVSFEIENDAKGRPQAKKVVFAGEQPPPGTFSISKYVASLLVIAFLILVGGATAAGKLPLAVGTFYFVVSVVAFVAYAFDKSAAKKDQWRTQESTLHLFALVGGWPGALIAQRLLRHKSKKKSFQVVFYITVVLNCSALGWLLSNAGTQWLRTYIPSDQPIISRQ